MEISIWKDLCVWISFVVVSIVTILVVFLVFILFVFWNDAMTFWIIGKSHHFTYQGETNMWFGMQFAVNHWLTRKVMNSINVQMTLLRQHNRLTCNYVECRQGSLENRSICFLNQIFLTMSPARKRIHNWLIVWAMKMNVRDIGILLSFDHLFLFTKTHI